MRNNKIKIFTPNKEIYYLSIGMFVLSCSLILYSLIWESFDYLLILSLSFFAILSFLGIISKGKNKIVVDIEKQVVIIKTLWRDKEVKLSDLSEIKSVTVLPLSQIALVGLDGKNIIDDIHLFFKNIEECEEFIKLIQEINPKIKDNVRFDSITGLTLYGSTKSRK